MEESFNLTEYLNIDASKKANIDKIFELADSYLTSIQTTEFPKAKVTILDSVIQKYINCAERFHIGSKLLESIKIKTDEFKKNIISRSYTKKNLLIGIFTFYNKRTLEQNNDDFNQLYGIFISSYSKLIEHKKYSEFDGFFKPSNSTKDRIKFLITKCISLINEDDTLKPKAKAKFTKQLNEISTQLDSPYSNWTIILGKIKETIYIMGALGGIATGAINVINQSGNTRIPKLKLTETVEILNEIEEQLSNSYRVTPDEFNDTFHFANRLSFTPQNVDFVTKSLDSPSESKNDPIKEDPSYAQYEEIEIIKEEE